MTDSFVVSNIGEDRNPYAAYAEARARAPVALTTHFGAPVIAAYAFDEAEHILRDGKTFSAKINGKLNRPLLGKTILEMDGRNHFVHRKLIGHAFRPTVAATWEDKLIRPLAHALVDGFAPRGKAELVREFAWELPVRVFAEIIGVPSVDYAKWQGWAVALEQAAHEWDRALQAAQEAHDYFQPVIEERRANPGDDLISSLATAEIDGVRLDDDLIHGFLRLLVPAGAGTTYRLIGSMLYALLTNPEVLDAVRADRSLIPGCVEETLRWEAPVQFAMRNATTDADVAGVPVQTKEVLVMALGSANRDESRYEDPNQFDIKRHGPPHLSFGDGAHRCLGEHLARVEGHAALDVLLDRLEDLKLEPGDADPHIIGFAFRSPTALPVTFKAT
ncbi:MAG: cytochrome P450 [Actinomycetota bacterium]|nr:cytochrome P450 [Actinomycetota bacterium]